MSDNIKVVVKVRPLISREIEDKSSYQWRVKNDTLYQLDQNGKDCGASFTFDKVYDKETATKQVYNDVAKPIVEAAIAGFNGTIFAYGQTSSGKTYTMSGTDESPGIIPQAVLNLFDKIKQIPDRDFLVRVSYIEIYNETLKDLLNVEKRNIKIHDTVQSGVKVDVTERVTASPDEVLDAMKEGEANRQTGATNMNEESSRSHSIFQITIESREHTEGEEDVGVVNVSQLNLVDLAGSERAGQTGATGLRFKEGTHINKSLSTLALVIKQLAEIGPNSTQKYINYRDSKLTRILQNSLGGNAKTSIICAITPASVEETISTLQFANRAKAIKNTPEVNAVASDTSSTMIQTLTKQLCKLQAQLVDKRSLEQDNANLQNKISNLQKVILNGFVQNSSMEISQSRRKMQNMRRVTICTLQPITETEESMPSVPKFRTPSLKYNPLSLSLSTEPVQTTSKTSLAALPEEERMVTPPPTAGIESEIINLDDSDEAADLKTCSPYHKCFEQSKTPPCVLRTNAKTAEKNLKDIMEFASREKLYTPDTVELLEKLDQNGQTITQLQEQVVSLQDQSKEKDSQITELKNKLTQTEELVKSTGVAKKSLESQCNELTAKLTDLEVSYETLQKKSKRREEELLFLLEEEKASKKTDNTRKSISREINLMDLSRDISLVNSDIESSLTHPTDTEPSAHIDELVAQLQAQLSEKNDAILTLESNLYAEKQKIESLESSIDKLHVVINEFNNKFPQLDTENAFLKSTIETLNSTIENQKVCLANAHKDMACYNSTIQELQITLSRKEIPNFKINDSALETMIANEEAIIANNENLRNIVHSFKLTINSKNKELDGLKTQMLDSLEAKEEQINTLTEQIQTLNDQMNENVEIINRLMENEKDLSTKLIMTQDNNDSLLKQIEQNAVGKKDLKEQNSELSNDIQQLKTKLNEAEIQLRKQKEIVDDLEKSNQRLNNIVDELEIKLADAQKQNDSLKEQIEENAKQINHLESTNLKLINVVEEKEVFVKEINSKHSVLSEEYEIMSQKIINLEKEIMVKNEDVIKLGEINKQTEDNLLKIKFVYTKLQETLSHLDTNVWEAPDNVDSLETAINVLIEGVNSLQVANRQFLEEHNRAMEDIQQEHISVEAKYKSEISLAHDEIEKIKNIRDDSVNLCEQVWLEISNLKDKLDESHNELHEKEQAITVLESQLHEANENSESLRKDLHVKDEIMKMLKDNITTLESEMKLLTLVDYEAKNGLKQTNSDLSKAMEEMKILSLADEEAINGLKQTISDLTKAIEDREKSYEEMVIIKNKNISELETRLVVIEKVLEAKRKEVIEVTEQLYKVVQCKDVFLTDVHDKVSKLTHDFNIENNEPTESDDDGENIYKNIINSLNKLLDVSETKSQIVECECKNRDFTNILEQAKKDIAELTDKNLSLMEEFAVIERKNNEMLNENQNVAILTKDLSGARDLLADLKSELTAKVNELLIMEKKAVEWKDQFTDMQTALQQKISQLEVENNLLRIQSANCSEKTSPLSLSAICCRFVMEKMQLVEKQSSVTSSKSSVENQNAMVQVNTCHHTEMTQTNKEKSSDEALDAMIQVQTCECANMTQKINEMMEDNLRLAETIQELESANQAISEKQNAIVQVSTCLYTDTTQTNEKASMEALDAMIQVQTCECVGMSQKINELMENNLRLAETIQELESANQILLEKQDAIVQVNTCQYTKMTQTNEKASMEALDAIIQVQTCECAGMTQKINELMENNLRLAETIQEIESANQILLDNQDATVQVNTCQYTETTQTNNATVEALDAMIQVQTCECVDMRQKINELMEDNLRLAETLQELESANQALINEQDEVRKEIRLLVEPANELRKKIVNHRTNLSTLTATTLAENKLLNSQVKVMKHHHTRYINVCQRDIPSFKSQLLELMAILKDNESFVDRQNAIIKRYSLPDVLDNNQDEGNFRNESTLDGDLLMLDTNLTMASAESTLLGYDQSCLDSTQIIDDDVTETSKSIVLYSQKEWLPEYDKKLLKTVIELKEENSVFREHFVTCPLHSKRDVHKVDSQTSQDTNTLSSYSDTGLNTADDSKLNQDTNSNECHEKLLNDIKKLEQDLENMQAQKEEIEKKYTDLTLEIPTTGLLVKQLNIKEKEHKTELEKIAKQTKDLEKKSQLIKDLQDENDQLSTQIMENISEVDDLRKELDSLKELNSKHLQLVDLNKVTENMQTDSQQKVTGIMQTDSQETVTELIQTQEKVTENVQTDVQGLDCSQTTMNNELLKSMQSKVTDQLLKLNQSLCDSERKLNKSTENISRLNKICTLQQEIHESKEDAKQIAETVSIAINTLEQSDYSMSMGLDQSISNVTHENKTSDNLHMIEKMECLKYYMEITGKENFSADVKLIDILKSFYNNLVSKHGEEVENLANKLRDLKETETQLHSRYSNLADECEKLTKEITLKDNYIKNFNQVLKNIRTNIELFYNEQNNITDEDKNKKLALMFNEQVLRLLDKEFQISSSNVFESLINSFVNKHQQHLEDATKRYSAERKQVTKVEAEFNEVNNLLVQIKVQLTEKETENNLLKAQKEKIREISNAVTLDIIKREQHILEMLKSGYDHLVESNIMTIDDVDLTLPLDASINLLFKKIKDLSTHSDSETPTEMESLSDEIIVLKNTLEVNEQKLATLETAVLQKEEELAVLKSENKDIQNNLEETIHRSKEAHKTSLEKIEELEKTILQSKQELKTSQERIEELKLTILDKDQTISLLENKINQENAGGDANNVELVQKFEELIKEIEDLKSVNNIIKEEKQQADLELQKSGEVIRQKKQELDKLTADIMVLKETVNDNVAAIVSLKLEAKALHEQNELLKVNAEEKAQECARLKMNIKTHEKTAEIQSKMIHRLQKQKEEDDKSIKDKDGRLDELTKKCLDLQKECEAMTDSIKTSKEEMGQLKTVNSNLEDRVLKLEIELEDNLKRPSLEAISESSRRRRQSLHDSNRLFADDRIDDDHAKIEAMFESRAKPDDLFLDCESGHSNRSTPVRLSRGRDSLKPEHSEDEPLSRPSSVLATRRRRQSIHDLHRNVVPTPTLHDQPHILETESQVPNKPESDLSERLASCQQELEDLKEKYRELDEECEICAQYLQERDARCAQLKMENKQLEQHVAELNSRLKTIPKISEGESKMKFCDASVNTNEDWANLHSVVVDRMSFDAEVEKNKKLTRTIEELRYKNHDLKTTLQKLMDKYNSGKDARELEQTKSQLKCCQQELEELKQRYQELDEECETCAQYLKERDEQCRKLREVKTALESKLQEYEANTSVAQSVKKKRQSVHDQSRAPATDYTDATTDTADDLLSYPVTRDSYRADVTGSDLQANEVKQLRYALDKVLMEKSVLEHKLMAFHPTMYVATGSAIVQSQQLTDVMKENQKLKRMNAKLVEICKKRGKSRESRSRDNRENEDPEQMTLG